MAIDSLPALATIIRTFREDRGLSQAQLAERAGNISRTAVAHLEQGLRLPPEPHLRAIAKTLAIPLAVLEPYLRAGASLRLNFEGELGELIGIPVSIANLDRQAVAAVESAISSLIGTPITAHQAYDTLREILVFYGLRPVSKSFFEAYFGTDSFQSIDKLSASVRTYQKDAIRLFPTFSQAYEIMNSAPDINGLLAPLRKRPLEQYTNRAEWNRVEEIEESKLRDLGYIAAAKLDKERREREDVVSWLRELAELLRTKGRVSIDEHKPKRQREMESLLRKFGARLLHGPVSPLFSPTPDELEAEANRLAPKDATDRDRIAATQEQGLRNLSQYLAADHMDVYIATSMRDDADFVSVNRFTERLFSCEDVRPLKLRYFNPTQSWIDDRIAKGLVEALMLRRSTATIYMAQKSDTFGKDSEASVALGQGKPVIVYVPRLHVPEADLDSSQLGRATEEGLRKHLRELDTDDAPSTMDHEALLGSILNLRLGALSPEVLALAAFRHWADFGLDSEATRIREDDTRKIYLDWIRRITECTSEDLVPSMPSEVRDAYIDILVSNSIRFERRATLFREKHPLALQVILSTGVLNGILVARSIESCGTLLRKVLENNLELDLVRGDESYRLIERTTNSTIRVISRHRLLQNAFASFYSAH